MPGLEDFPTWLTGTAGVAFMYFGYRFFWPAIKGSLSGQATQWRSENRYIAQLEESRDQAYKERDEAVRERNELYHRLANLEAQMQVLEFKFDRSQEEVKRLMTKLQQSTRGPNETDL